MMWALPDVEWIPPPVMPPAFPLITLFEIVRAESVRSSPRRPPVMVNPSIFAEDPMPVAWITGSVPLPRMVTEPDAGALEHAVDHVDREDLARARGPVEAGCHVDGVARRQRPASLA